jgi:hypothetical protein
MRSAAHGRLTSSATVENLTPFGMWLLVCGEELFLSREDFPMFAHATVDGLLHVELHGDDHLYWPELDIDLEIDSIRQPENFPMISRGKIRSKKVPRFKS